jgi:hypothetical protein
MNRVRISSVILFLFLFSICTNALAQGQSGIAINPTGFLTGGFSYIEYEKMTHKWISIAFRGDYITSDFEKREGDHYLYTEEFTAVGGGISSRLYFFTYHQLSGFYMGLGSEFLSVDWKWDEDDYGVIDGAEGTDFTWGLHYQMGLKITFGKLYIDPSFYTGWFSLNKEDFSMGGFFQPSVAVGIRF